MTNEISDKKLIDLQATFLDLSSGALNNKSKIIPKLDNIKVSSWEVVKKGERRVCTIVRKIKNNNIDLFVSCFFVSVGPVSDVLIDLHRWLFKLQREV